MRKLKIGKSEQPTWLGKSQGKLKDSGKGQRSLSSHYSHLARSLKKKLYVDDKKVKSDKPKKTPY